MNNDEPLLLETVLRPSPPMSARALAIILAVVAAFNFAFAMSFVLRGAWPIAPFMGLDVLLLALAFRESRIKARAQRATRHISGAGSARELCASPEIRAFHRQIGGFWGRKKRVVTERARHHCLSHERTNLP